MHTFIFATNNRHKVDEIRQSVGNDINIITLQEAGINIDIPEPYDTLEENSKEKARVIYELTKQNCFSEDTGLEVFALNNEPGVKSARYAGEDANAAKNMEKLLLNMKGVENRKARFRTVITLVLQGEYHFFEGICEGYILNEPIGSEGFGYDPVFVPNGYSQSFAQLGADQKNKISHRALAVNKLIQYLQK